MCEIAIDICVIKFHAVDDGEIGVVVKKLRPLIEKRRIVLIPFPNKVLSTGYETSFLKIVRNRTARS